jgi:hypothetical protein
MNILNNLNNPLTHCGYPTNIEIRPHPKRGGTILTLAIQKVSQFPLIFNYRKNVAKVRPASFHLHKRLLKSFGRSVEIWYNFSKRSDSGVPRLLAAGRFSTRRAFVLGTTALPHSIGTSSHGRCPAHPYKGWVPNNDAGETSVPSVDSVVKMSEPIWPTFLARNALLFRTARQSPRSWNTTCPPTLTSSGSVET